MSEEDTNENVMLELMKELVEKVKGLEHTVYNQSNMLMKSGVVMRDTPHPSLQQGSSELPDMNTIQKMSWQDIDKLVAQAGGN